MNHLFFALSLIILAGGCGAKIEVAEDNGANTEVVKVNDAQKTVRVRYMVDDVEEAIAFYVSNLGFELEADYSPAIAMVVHGNLTLLLAGPDSSAARPMLDGANTSPGGGWSRFVLTFDDLEATVSRLKDDGVKFKNDILENHGRKQILCMDPSGNVVELSQSAAKS